MPECPECEKLRQKLAECENKLTEMANRWLLLKRFIVEQENDAPRKIAKLEKADAFIEAVKNGC